MQNISSSPRPRTPFFRAIVAALPLLAGSSVLSGGPVEAAEGRAIAGQFHMGLVFGASCPSATGLCATGIVTGDLSGEIFITIDDLKDAQDPRGEMITHLSGEVLITTVQGDIQGKLRGVFDQATGEVRNTITFTGGDRNFRKMKGKLRVSGIVDLQNSAEVDDYSGDLTP